MKRFLSSCILTIILLINPLFVPLTAFADTYGSGSYGNGVYGAQSSSNSNSIASAITTVGNAVSTFFCSNQAPSSAPNLYEIDVTSTTATVYFSPAGGPYDNHYISYGQGDNSEGYGIQLQTSQSPGALFYKIQQLSPSTIYTFKVRGGNGCKPGPWSNTLTVQTLSSRSKSSKKFYPNSQAQYVKAPSANWWNQTENYISSLLPSAPNTGLAPTEQHSKTASSTLQHNPSSPPTSLWGSVTNFFSGIFHIL